MARRSEVDRHHRRGSTPNNKIGETIVRICAIAGLAGALEAAIQ